MDAEDKTKQEKVIHKLIEDEMKSSYIDYAMSVIVGRALPDVRDGLKPVHRRILFAMHEMGIVHNKSFKKSARIVGEVLGKFHPHGDSAVYDALVRMAQDFSLRHPLVKGQGNFGSIDGDSAAAMRYTEVKLAKISSELLADIEKATVKFIPNFDGSLKEPKVLPTRIPNLLINGASGIAVGMATNIPPHNLNEVSDAAIALVQNPELEFSDLIKFVKAPDFPTGGLICGSAGIMSAYKTGHGKVKIRAKADVIEKGNKHIIIVTEIPYMVNKSLLLGEIAQSVKNKIVMGITELRDESDKDGLRIVIELKKEAHPDIVLNQLYKHTKLEVTQGINLLALTKNEPKVHTLKEMLVSFLNHRRRVIIRRTKFDLKNAEKKAHILEGLRIALDNVDDIIALIKQASSPKEAKEKLISDYSLSEDQSQAILEMRLQKLTSLEQNKIKDDLKTTLELIADLKSILNSEEKINQIIITELEDIKSKYGEPRRSQIIEVAEDLEIEDLIEPSQVVVTMTHQNYVKRQPLDVYRQQRRGGTGITATSAKEEDFVENLFITNTHNYLLLFSDKGKVYWLKVYQIPESSRTAKGTPIINLIQLDKDEKIQAIVPVKDFDPEKYLTLATKKGIIKKTPLTAYSRPRQTGIIAISLDEDDELINAALTDGQQKIILATQNGMAIKFDEKDARPVGRTARGVKGITLKNADSVVGMVLAETNKTILTITDKGYGKRTNMDEYRQISRGGVGVINIKTNSKNGKVVTIKSISEDDDLMIISLKGIAIRIPAKGVSIIGRNTQGLRVMRLREGDNVVAAARVIPE